MESPVLRAFALAAGMIAVTITSNACCDKEELTICERKAKVAVSKNARMQNRLDKCNGEIDTLKEQLAREHKEQEALLAKCQEEANSTTESCKDEIAECFDTLAVDNLKMREQNASLTQQIRRLEAEVKKLKTR